MRERRAKLVRGLRQKGIKTLRRQEVKEEARLAEGAALRAKDTATG